MERLKVKKIGSLLKDYCSIMLSVILLMTFIFSQNEVPTSSMVTTINVGDRVIVSLIPFYYRSPKRGEIVVFDQGDEVWVKRVVGLPGEEINIINGDIYIDGVYFDESKYLKDKGISTPNPIYGPIDFPYIVPEGSYFLLGDNREESGDCRYIGAIREEMIHGKAICRIYPFSDIGLLNQQYGN